MLTVKNDTKSYKDNNFNQAVKSLRTPCFIAISFKISKHAMLKKVARCLNFVIDQNKVIAPSVDSFWWKQIMKTHENIDN